jgi:hypothetical protein
MKPIVKRERLPRNVEVTVWLIEAKRNNKKYWSKQIHQTKASKHI